MMKRESSNITFNLKIKKQTQASGTPFTLKTNQFDAHHSHLQSEWGHNPVCNSRNKSCSVEIGTYLLKNVFSGVEYPFAAFSWFDGAEYQIQFLHKQSSQGKIIHKKENILKNTKGHALNESLKRSPPKQSRKASWKCIQ